MTSERLAVWPDDWASSTEEARKGPPCKKSLMDKVFRRLSRSILTHARDVPYTWDMPTTTRTCIIYLVACLVRSGILATCVVLNPSV
eukprot:2190784-Pleurochrysis_carterae.AAC.1